MAKKLHWLVVNHLFWSDFEQLDWCLWKQLICTKFQQFWGNWPSSFAPYSHIFMMIPNIMGHLPLTEHIKAFSICFQLLGQQFDFSVFCSNSLAYGIVCPLCPFAGYNTGSRYVCHVMSWPVNADKKGFVILPSHLPLPKTAQAKPIRQPNFLLFTDCSFNRWYLPTCLYQHVLSLQM